MQAVPSRTSNRRENTFARVGVPPWSHAWMHATLPPSHATDLRPSHNMCIQRHLELTCICMTPRSTVRERSPSRRERSSRAMEYTSQLCDELVSLSTRCVGGFGGTREKSYHKVMARSDIATGHLWAELHSFSTRCVAVLFLRHVGERKRKATPPFRLLA